MYSRDLVLPHPRGGECRYRVLIEATNDLGHSWLGDLSADEQRALQELTTCATQIAADLLETDPIRNLQHRVWVLDTLLRRPPVAPSTWTTEARQVLEGLPTPPGIFDPLHLSVPGLSCIESHAALRQGPTDLPEERMTTEHGV